MQGQTDWQSFKGGWFISCKNGCRHHSLATGLPKHCPRFIHVTHASLYRIEAAPFCDRRLQEGRLKRMDLSALHGIVSLVYCNKNRPTNKEDGSSFFHLKNAYCFLVQGSP
jgi:hypothetical protein